MLYDEARLKQAHITPDTHRIAWRTEWEELAKLERLQRSIRVVRARLGLAVASGDGYGAGV